MKRYRYSSVSNRGPFLRVTDFSSDDEGTDSGSDFESTNSFDLNETDAETEVEVQDRQITNESGSDFLNQERSMRRQSDSEQSIFSDDISHFNDMYIFQARSRGNLDHLLIASLLYAFTYKGISEDAFNCVVSLLLSSYMHHESHIPRTLASMKKTYKREVDNYFSNVVTHSYCKRCSMKLTMGLSRTAARCNQCSSRLSLFAILDIYAQLKMIISNQHENIRNYQSYLSTSCTNGDNTLEVETMLGNDTDTLVIRLMICVDGGNPYQTASCSYWPLLAVILDLPPTIRYRTENILFVALWQGNTKPVWDIFLKSFMESFPWRESQELVIGNSAVKVSVSCTCGVFDLPAQASILNVKQYNGEFGCLYCLNPGISSNRTWIYPYQEDNTSISDEDFTRYARLANSTNDSVFGIKGLSILNGIVNIPSAICLDPLHLYFENLTKMLINFIIDSQNRHHGAFIGRRMRQINDLLVTLSPPSNIDRFRSIACVKFWTGREFQNFLFYVFIPIIGLSFPSNYLKHISSFVVGARLSLSKDAKLYSLTVKALFTFFVENLETLFSERQMTINSHLLLHIHQKIDTTGSLTYSSMAPFEAQFKVMKKLMKGTKNHFSQIIDKIMLMKSTHCYMLSNSDNASSLLASIQMSLKIHDHKNMDLDVQVLSRAKIRILHHIFCTDSYSEKDSYCKYGNLFGKIESILEEDGEPFVRLKKFRSLDIRLFDNDNIGLLLNEHFSLFYAFVELTDEKVTVAASHVRNKCFFIDNVPYESRKYSLLCLLPDIYTYT